MKLWKRVVSLLLVLVLVVGLIPVPAQAAGKQEATMDSGEITATGSNGLGVLISEEINERQAVEEAEASGRFAVSGLEVVGSTAIVEYGSLEDAIALVAIYTEDGRQMLLSGTAPVKSGQGKVKVKLEGTMPEYFMAMAYLVDIYDYSPLCPAYETPMYTREMQELKASTTEDYAPDSVLNLDGNKQTNFAVYAPGTIVIDEKPGENIVTSADDAQGIYVIEQADATVLGLQAGDVVVYPYGESSILVTKVTEVQVSGTTVTIIGGELELEEAFSQMKLENEGGSDEIIVDASTAGEGVQYEGKSEPVPEGPATKAWKDDVSLEKQLNFSFGKEGESGDFSWSFKGTLSLQVKASFSYYVSATRQFIEFKVDQAQQFKVELKGGVKGELLSLGTWGFIPCPGVIVGFEPAIILEFEAAVNGTIKSHRTFGFSLEHTDTLRWQNLSTPDQSEYSVNAVGKIFVGVDFGPTIEVIGGKIIKVKLSAKAGVEYEGKQVLLDEEMRRGEKKHECKQCVDMSLSGTLELAASCKILFFKTQLKLAGTRVHLGDAYFSSTFQEFGKGACPHITYRTVIRVDNAQGLPAEHVGIECTQYTRDGGLSQFTLGPTDSRGVVTEYLPAGRYLMKAEVDGRTVQRDFEVKEAQRVVLDEWSAKAGSFDGMIQGKVEDGAFQDDSLVASGEFGDWQEGHKQPDPVFWNLYANGRMEITGQGHTKGGNGDGRLYPWDEYGVPVRELVVGEGVTVISWQGLRDLKNLEKVTLPFSLTKVGGRAFEGCAQLREIHVADLDKWFTMEFQENGPFSNGTELWCNGHRVEEVVVPQGLTAIPGYAFEGCTSIRSVRFPESLKKIGVLAFGRCSGLQRVEIPGGVETYTSAFEGCESLEQVAIAPGVGEVPNYAFRDCTALRKVELPGSVAFLGERAFSGCTALEELRLPEGVKEIRSFALENCQSLKKITFPASLVRIADRAFEACRNIQQVHLADLRSWLRTEVNCAPFYDGAALWMDGKPVEHLVIPAGETALGANLFWGCGSLRSVSFPEGMTEIGERTFALCANLASVSLPQSLTTIGDRAFERSGLKKIEISDHVQSLGDEAFLESKLEEVTLPPIIEDMGDTVFGNTPWLNQLRYQEKGKGVYFQNYLLSYRPPFTEPIRPGTKVICGGVFAEGWVDINWTGIIIPDGVEVIGRRAFGGGKQIYGMELPDSVRHINAYAFEHTRLQSIDLPPQLETLGEGAFEGCTKLEHIRIPETITRIEPRTFADCWSMTDLKLPDTVTFLGSYSLYRCGVPARFVLPQKLETIEDRAIERSNALSITFPAGLKYYEGNAVCVCSNLQEIIFQGDIPETFPHASLGQGNDIINAYYPAGNPTWTADRLPNLADGYVRWYPYTLGADGGMIPGEQVKRPGRMAKASAEAGTAEQQVRPSGVFDGEYDTGVENGTTVKKATFRGLVPGQEYLLLAMADAKAVEPLAAENLLYVRQGQAAEDGTLAFTYIQRTPAEVSFVMACGASSKHLKDATITVPAMEERPGESQSVEIAVVYDGKTLREGWDYTVSGQVDFTEAGEYVCFVRGIREYAGLMKCTYTVKQSDKLAAPVLEVKSDWDSGRPHLTWTAVEGAAGYEVWGAAFPQEKVRLATTDKLEMMDLETVVGEEYRYEVRAVDGPRKGAFSQEAGAFCRCARPVMTGEVNENGQPSLRWNAVEGAVGYEIGRAESGRLQPIAKVEGLQFVDTTAEKGKNYHYQVRALGTDRGGDSVWSRMVEISTSLLKAPVVKAYTDGLTGGPYLTWNSVDGADGYEIWRAVHGEKMALLETVTESPYTDTTATPGVAYHYQVRSVSGEDKSDFSADVVRWGTCAVPQVTLTTRSDGKPVLSWQAVAGAVRYSVSYSDNGGDFQTLKEVNGTTLTHSSAKPGHTYKYVVKALCAVEGCNSVWSQTVSITMPEEIVLGVPEVTLSNVASSGKPYIRWTAVDGAARYEVWRATSRDGSYSRIYSTASGDHVTNGRAEAGRTFYYKVRAIGADGTEGAFSAVKYRTCDLPQPQVTMTMRSDGKPVLSWDAIDGAVKYEVWRSVDGGGFSRLSSPIGTKLTNSSAQAGHTYAYKVRAICSRSAGNSAWSYYDTVTVK